MVLLYYYTSFEYFLYVGFVILGHCNSGWCWGANSFARHTKADHAWQYIYLI